MEKLQVKDKSFVVSITEAEIQSQVRRVATEITRDMEGKHPLFLPVLNGSFIFAADLLREIPIACEISFIKLASYQGTQSSGEIREVIGLNTDITGRHVIIVEDIIDTGLTIHFLKEYIRERYQPRHLYTVLLIKRVRKDASYKEAPDFCGMEFDSEDYVCGFGFDHYGLGRSLPYVFVADQQQKDEWDRMLAKDRENDE